MIVPLREHFNREFTEEKYRSLVSRLNEECGTRVSFRICETPVFIPSGLMSAMETAGAEIIAQLMTNTEYRKHSERSVPEEYRVPGESTHPLFLSLDFGIVRDETGALSPRLIELQGFPTLYAYQPVLTRLYKEVYGLGRELESLLGGLDVEMYHQLLRKAVLGDHVPENVILMEIDPLQQKTLPDFLLTERLCGISTVNIRDITKQGSRLFYRRKGTLIPISRIYNRTIIEDLSRSGARLSFSFSDDLQVEWAGHPNWFFKLSKFSLPFLRHPAVPQTFFLSDLPALPDDLENWVLKPLFSFAGSGVTIAPTRAAIKAVPDRIRDKFVLQRRVHYGEFVQTPHGGTKAEVRIMYVWFEKPLPVNNLVRMGRGQLMGVNQNRDLKWVGSSAGLWAIEGTN